MARSFDGTNDNLVSANNAVSGLNVSTKSFGFWTQRSINGNNDVVATLMQTNSGGSQVVTYNLDAPTGGTGFRLVIQQSNTTPGTWKSDDIAILNAPVFCVITYDRSNLANDPTFDANGTSLGLTETSTPAGTIKTADDTLKIGESAGGVNDLNGLLQHLVLADGIWGANQKNRVQWWARPGGPLLICLPLLTTKLTDEGGNGETLTANGTTMSSMITPVVRPGVMAMGCGVGW